MKTKYVVSRKITCVSEPTAIERVQVTNSGIAVEFARQFYHDDIELYESFFLIMMNKSHVITSYAKISQGGVTGTVVDPKIIAKYAVDDLCSAVILVHNHPSGSLKTSKPDVDITNKIVGALKFFDCQVLDHIILTKDSYYSFKDDNFIL